MKSVALHADTCGTEMPALPKVHLSYLDGVRGLAALYVVIYHACETAPLHRTDHGLKKALYHLLAIVSFGQAAVAVFIVLSGYCLMLPIVRAKQEVRGGGRHWGDYIKRRARRILPPYYAALVFTLLLIAILPQLRTAPDVPWSSALPAFDTATILSHLFLVHNLSSAWSHKIDYPMWSVATEWQIYFIFPILLIIQRHKGLLVTSVAALTAGILPHFLFHAALDQAHFEYIGLFAFGMSAAIINFSQNVQAKWMLGKVPWKLVVLFSLLPIAALAKYREHYSWLYALTINVTVGLATACLLICCTRQTTNQTQQKFWPLTIFQSRPCIMIGTFSYSLYLTHAPVLEIVYTVFRASASQSVMAFGLSLFIQICAALIIAYLFGLVFERPYMRPPPQRNVG